MLLPVLAMGLVSQTLTEWAKVLWQSFSTGQVDPVYMDLVDQLLQGLKYIYDASLDAALRFGGGASVGALAQMQVC